MPVLARHTATNFERSFPCAQWNGMNQTPWTLISSDCDADKKMIGPPYASNANAATATTSTTVGGKVGSNSITSTTYSVSVPAGSLVDKILVVSGVSGIVECTVSAVVQFSETQTTAVAGIYAIDKFCATSTTFAFTGLGNTSTVYIYYR